MESSMLEFLPQNLLTTNGHAPSMQIGPPEAYIKLMPAGTAPPDRSFATGLPTDINPSEAICGHAGEEAFVSAQDSIVGAISKDAHVGLGHLGHGQPASQKNFHKERSVLQGRWGNMRDWVKERGLDCDYEKGGKLTSVGGMVEILGAEDRLPTRAEELATERQ